MVCRWRDLPEGCGEFVEGKPNFDGSAATFDFKKDGHRFQRPPRYLFCQVD